MFFPHVEAYVVPWNITLLVLAFLLPIMQTAVMRSHLVTHMMSKNV